MNENRNLIAAALLSAVVLFGWEYFIAGPQLEKERARQALLHHEHPEAKPQAAPNAPSSLPAAPSSLSRADALKAGGARIAIDTPSLDGSLLLKGSRFDDLRLKKYRETTNPKSPEIVLFSPVRTSYPYYAVFGWVAPPGSGIKTPDDNSAWKVASGTTLTPTSPVTLTWDNGQGLVFTRTISVDKNYMFAVRDQVANHGHGRITLYPYGYVARDGLPPGQQFMALHEGFVGVADGTLQDAEYKPPTALGLIFGYKGPPQTFQSTGGWFGITDKYWMAAVIPPQSAKLDAGYQTSPLGSTQAYQANYRLGAQNIAPGATATVNERLFAGAKIDQLLQNYEDKEGVTKFHLAIDWGWFWFFTQPIFYVLDFLSQYMNMGLAILLLTVLIKIAFFPLADASYRSMSRMKKLQPEMERIKAQFKDDQQQQQQAIMELYRREKINPVSGCLPMLIQIPVFYSLYKVLLGTIEMRQAPFFGWVHDLSAADPTSILNLFGLLPYDPHALPHIVAFLGFLNVGMWPIIMGCTQWFQMKLNPPAPDPVQQRMYSFMPLIFTFMLSSLPAGLVIYWTWNNILTTAQQYVVMRRQGVKVDFLGNMNLKGFAKRFASNDKKRLVADDKKSPSTDSLPGE
ncbi:MAG TPA: membrane protein insertase YidC [Rhizomicrobium sp.]|nr:membrane protein insertase YidC [Rhizomicrobium sp.]